MRLEGEHTMSPGLERTTEENNFCVREVEKQIVELFSEMHESVDRIKLTV